MSRQPFVYLASPYRHKDPQVMHRRFEQAISAMLHAWEIGYPAFAPIVYTHPISVCLPWLPNQRYQSFDDRILAVADELWILQLDGWEQSEGLRHEEGLAKAMGKQVRYAPPSPMPYPIVDWQAVAEKIASWARHRPDNL